MTTDSIFNADKSVTPAETKEQGLFAALVGETQKYKSAEDLAKAYSNADAFIEQLKEENRKLREANVQAKTIDEVLERISKTGETKVVDTPPAFSEDKVAELVERTLTGREVAKVQETNLLQADKLMKEKFGDKAGEVFKSKAATPELAKVYMELAARSPQDFVSLFASSVAPSTSMDMGSMNTASVPTSMGDRTAIEGTKEWATKIRKENPSLYWSQEFQVKMQKTVLNNPSLYFGN
jgi:hypothetical protein